jgi:hypothetical protein
MLILLFLRCQIEYQNLMTATEFNVEKELLLRFR